ncbi:MAG: Cell division integral membrane protein, YggT and half-length relatives, partial [uncultured Frankineae bacterium]
ASRRRRRLLRAAGLPAAAHLPADHGVRLPARPVLPSDGAGRGSARAGVLRDRSAAEAPAAVHPPAAHRPGEPGPRLPHPVHRGAHPDDSRRRPAL